ncbi:MAG: hypothetical protein HOV86_06190 [Thermoactinospora sp.]|nr:hypothetical protein [Thermoactinospora sp.]
MRSIRQIDAGGPATVVSCVLILVLSGWAAMVLTPSLDYPPERLERAAVWLLLGLPLYTAGFLLLAGRIRPRLGGWLMLVGVAHVAEEPLRVLAALAELPLDPWIHLVAAIVRGTFVLTAPLWLPGITARRSLAWTVCAIVAAFQVVEQGLGTQRALAAATARSSGLMPQPAGPLYGWLLEHQRELYGALGLLVAATILIGAAGTPARRLRLTGAYVVWSTLFISEIWGESLAFPAALAGALLGFGLTAWTVGRARLWHLERGTRRMLVVYTTVAVLALLDLLFLGATAYYVEGVRAEILGAAVLTVGMGVRPVGGWAVRKLEGLFFGAGVRPHEAVRALAERLDRAPEPQEVPGAVCRSVVEDLGMPGARLEVEARPSESVTLAAAGEPVERGECFELSYQERVIGRLRVLGPDEGRLPAREAQLITLLAGQATPALAALQLLEEVRAAREQLIRSWEMERRRLYRDLHDGLGPHISALRLLCDTLRSGDCASPERVIEQLAGGINEMSVLTRRLIDRLIPTELEERGLYGAVTWLAGRLGVGPLRIEVRADQAALRGLPLQVGTVAYQIVGEALTNVVKHAHATRAVVGLELGAGELVVTVEDNGLTGASPVPGPRRGTGLGSIADRAAALGGWSEVKREAGGTRVRVGLRLQACSG